MKLSPASLFLHFRFFFPFPTFAPFFNEGAYTEERTTSFPGAEGASAEERATSFPGSLIFPPPLAPAGGKMRDPGNEVEERGVSFRPSNFGTSLKEGTSKTQLPIQPDKVKRF